MKRAQQNLCRRLRLPRDDPQPFEIALLLEFVAIFSGPLPDQVIPALAEMFNLDYGSAMEINDALSNMAGEGIADLHEAQLPAAT